jgi:hypothetical protein
LRRAWSADPAIRDFRGLQEYDWDFEKPGAMAGFGELGSDTNVKQMVARLFGEEPGAEPHPEAGPVASGTGQPVDSTEEPASADGAPDGDAPAALSHDAGETHPLCGTDESKQTAGARQQLDDLMQRNKEVAVQHDDLTANSGQKNRRLHGGALPKT